MYMEVWTTLTSDLKGMSRKEHFWYWIFPVVLLSVLMAFFFSGVPALVEMVNPKMVHPEMNKEWGLLENIQLVVVAVILGVSVYASIEKKPILQKVGFGLISVFALFVFLEEIDYGSHLVEYITGTGKSQLARLTGVYNLHNYAPSTAKIFKRSVYVLMLLLFIFAPFLRNSFQNRIITYLIPHPKIVIVALLTIVCEVLARVLVPLNGLQFEELGMDIGEFSEIMVYCVFLIYLWQLIFEKEWVSKK